MYKQEALNTEFDSIGSPDADLNLPETIDVNDMNGVIKTMFEGFIDDFGVLIPSAPNSESELAQYQDESTMDVAKAEMQPFHPLSPRGPPERHDFAGALNFSVEINGADTNRKKYMFSASQNRIYVDIKTDFPMHFRWDMDKAPSLFVRATVVFADDAQAQKRVERCTQHTHEPSNAILDPVIVKNVLHSSRERNTPGVYYCGSTEPDYWYSVVVQVSANMTANGYAPVAHTYQFVCKNSCSTGINRRPIEIIFSLEDSFGQVLGRQSVGARVCSCPRRDMQRDEKEEPKGKRRIQPAQRNPEPRTKRVKLDGDDSAIVQLPPLQIVGTKIMLSGLEVMKNMMEHSASICKNDPQAVENYNKSVAAIKKYIGECKK